MKENLMLETWLKVFMTLKSLIALKMNNLREYFMVLSLLMAKLIYFFRMAIISIKCCVRTAQFVFLPNGKSKKFKKILDSSYIIGYIIRERGVWWNLVDTSDLKFVAF